MIWGLHPMALKARRADTKRMNRAWLVIYIAAALYALFQSVVIVKVVPAIWL